MKAYNRKKKPLGSTKLKYKAMRYGKDNMLIAGYECCNRNRFGVRGTDYFMEYWDTIAYQFETRKYKGYEILNESFR